MCTEVMGTIFCVDCVAVVGKQAKRYILCDENCNTFIRVWTLETINGLCKRCTENRVSTRVARERLLQRRREREAARRAGEFSGGNAGGSWGVSFSWLRDMFGKRTSLLR